jgi:hypothetical protein
MTEGFKGISSTNWAGSPQLQIEVNLLTLIYHKRAEKLFKNGVTLTWIDEKETKKRRKVSKNKKTPSSFSYKYGIEFMHS